MNKSQRGVVHNLLTRYDEMLAEIALTLRDRREARDKQPPGTTHDAMQRRIDLLQEAYDLMVKHKYGECQ